MFVDARGYCIRNHSTPIVHWKLLYPFLHNNVEQTATRSLYFGFLAGLYQGWHS